MIFTQTPLSGSYVIEIERVKDQRGFFARTYCQHEFEEHGLNSRIVQCNLSFNQERGTLRGMHFQAAPFQEAKLVRCTNGAIFDVIIDLRRKSPTFLKHFDIVLSAENSCMLYVPEGFAHGFLTLEDQTTVFYQMSEFYEPSAARGFRWNDPLITINWPIRINVISERDATYADISLDSFET